MDITDISLLGPRLRQIREAHDLTQAQVAEKAGVGRRFVSELERGKASCELAKAIQVIEAAGGALALYDQNFHWSRPGQRLEGVKSAGQVLAERVRRSGFVSR